MLTVYSFPWVLPHLLSSSGMKYFWMLRFVRNNYSNSSCKMKPSFKRLLTSGTAINYSQNVAPIIKAEPTRGLVDESVKIEITHLLPNQQITLHSKLLSEDNDWWMSYAHYVSDVEGNVRVSHDKSWGGSYTGQEPMGFIWSMKLAPGSREGMRLRKKDVTTPLSVTVSVHSGWISSNFDMETVLASVVLERFYMAPGTTKLQFRNGRVVGTLFLPPGPGPFPAVLDMWGGGGGLVEYRASLFASRGFAALALAHTGHKDLPPAQEIFEPSLSYFEEAFVALENHPKIAKGRVALVGLSLGFTVALLMATELRNIHPKCLVCISGSHFNLIQNGDSILFQDENDHADKVKFAEDGAMIWKYIPLPFTDSKSMVKVDKIRCPLLIICGDDDQNWPAFESVFEIQDLMKAAGNDHLLTTVVYPQTGHLIEPPYSPHFRTTRFKINSINKIDVMGRNNKTSFRCSGGLLEKDSGISGKPSCT
ncbi:acyl-coenzyme A thioesterase 5-like isoform X3 [Hemitrygon akajei]|uniref:acyl-coenzyme A thioesterase 5-like isoform X3 n=1 Tax=Hemitrygon akajei TaxID=2704970 RepID=UPI003BF9FC6D